LVAHNDFARST